MRLCLSVICFAWEDYQRGLLQKRTRDFWNTGSEHQTTNKIGLTILKEWITLNSRKTPSTTNLEEEEIVDAPENDGNASMPEPVKRPNPWKKKKMMTMLMVIT
jgi:hypothetical protein